MVVLACLGACAAQVSPLHLFRPHNFCTFFKNLNIVLRIVLFLELHQSIFGWASEKWGQWLALPMQCQVIVKGPREGQFLPFAKNVRRGLLAAATATLDCNPLWRSIHIILHSQFVFSLSALNMATSRSWLGGNLHLKLQKAFGSFGIMYNVSTILWQIRPTVYLLVRW